MEWTDSACSELDHILEQVRATLDPNEVDPDEVSGDIRNRIETELSSGNGHIVTAENVRSAARKLGIQDMVSDHQPVVDTHRQEFKSGIEKPHRRRSAFATGWFWFTGIILPLVALGIEMTTHLCLDTGLSDPLPTPFHAVLILLVPLACLLGWRFNHDRKSLPIRQLGLLMGMATMIAIYYSLIFITITPFAIMGFAAIIYFGIGLLCFLPLSPLLSLLALLRLHFNLKKKTEAKIPLFKRGIMLGLVAILFTSAPMYLTKIGLTMATSEQPSTKINGIRLLRWIGDEALMNRSCYWGVNMPSDPVSWLINGGQRVSPEEARDIYYRATGEAFNTKASPTFGIRSRRNPGDEYDWDPEQGGDVVAGVLKGLSLTESRMDGVVHSDAATAYLEWTMVFRNDWRTEREARAQIALPPGAAVSRLTLWIDGEEREAAFGGRSQVKQAYKDVVVRQRRDPVLVTTYGPDRILMQCFPVPANGEMKVRIGITAPMECLSQTDRALRLPHMLERNFRIPQNVKHAVWIDDHMISDLTDQELNSPAAHISATSSNTTCWASDGDITVLQEVRAFPAEGPDRIAIVLDTSIGMKHHLDEIAAAMKSLPSDIPLSVWIATDGEPEEIAAADLHRIKAGGGKDNTLPLRKALTGSSDCVVWIHGPQVWDLGSSENLRQTMERGHGRKLYDFQIDNGPNRLIEKMDSLSGFATAPRYGSVEEDLMRLFRSLSSDRTVWMPVRSAINQGDPNVFQTDSHLIRLYALDQIRADLSDGKPGNGTAVELALRHHLVTPVSGAVVLETQQQYAENNLQPVDSDNVPGVPEPGTLTLLLIAFLFIVFGKRIIRHIRAKLALA